ncbi:MAG: T9SS type B sorting domain-containing protein, partial [Kaistella sp.]
GEPRTAYFIKINNAFTPNADGINDVWKVENLEKMENVSIIIVDRYGNKVFESQNSGKVEWDGKNGGRELPTSTYWYTVTWFDAVTQKSEQRQGWILMKNRN